MLSGPCEACIEEEHQNITEEDDGENQDVTNDDDGMEPDHGEEDLELLMSGANEENPAFAAELEQAMLAGRERREQEAYATMVDQRGAAHLNEARDQLRERIEASRILPQYYQEQPVYVAPAVFWVHEPSEMREVLARRAAYEVAERHTYSGSEEVVASGEWPDDRTNRPDLSGPLGRLRRRDRMARYFHGTPVEPYGEPMAWQLQGCASTAEQEMLEQGYGESVSNDRWHNYWDSPNGDAETFGSDSARSRLEHLGEVESRNQSWYHDPDGSPW